MAFQVTGETLIRRSDDNPEALKKRLATYHRETVPLIAFYKTRNLHRMVDASQKTEVVFDNIKKIFADARGKLTCFRYGLRSLRRVLSIMIIKSSLCIASCNVVRNCNISEFSKATFRSSNL